MPGICGNGTCRNTPGGHVCTCFDGFRLSVNNHCEGETDVTSLTMVLILMSPIICDLVQILTNVAPIQASVFAEDVATLMDLTNASASLATNSRGTDASVKVS